jgi:hypothetical protein
MHKFGEIRGFSCCTGEVEMILAILKNLHILVVKLLFGYKIRPCDENT